MQFIGHLDLMRGWQKFFRKSGIPIAYSEGFSPHQVFSIAAPLPVGVTGESEYLDLKLDVDDYSMATLVEQINTSVPEGITVLDAYVLQPGDKAGMASCYAADYRIYLSNGLSDVCDWEATLETFINQDSILMEKKNKKGKLKEIDIKPGIFDYKLESANCLWIRLATGSSLNIKPNLFMKAFFDVKGIELEQFTRESYYRVKRLEIYQSLEPIMPLIPMG